MELQVFENSEFGKIRTIMLDEVPWFVGRDVANILGYSNTRKAILDHVDTEDKNDGVTIRDSIGREQNPILINESGVYALIFASKLPTAKSFKHWVTSEVLPSIRKTGSYLTPELQNRLDILKQRSAYLDAMMAEEHLTCIRDTAKLLRIPQKLFTHLLEDMDFAYRNSENRLTPHSGAEKNGYARLVAIWNKDRSYTGLQMKITPLGRLYLFCRFKRQLALPYTIEECLSIETVEQ